LEPRPPRCLLWPSLLASKTKQRHRDRALAQNGFETLLRASYLREIRLARSQSCMQDMFTCMPEQNLLYIMKPGAAKSGHCERKSISSKGPTIAPPQKTCETCCWQKKSKNAVRTAWLRMRSLQRAHCSEHGLN